jgi:Na+/H+-dicarboxylate symporter
VVNLVDEIMDMARTATNVVGNCLASIVVAKWEGVFDADTVPVSKAEATYERNDEKKDDLIVV